MDVNKWWEWANSTLPRDRQTQGYAVPDTAYDSLREKFFYDVMAPEIASRGNSPEESKAEFLKSTTRPGKSAHPRAELLGKSLLQGLTAPFQAGAKPAAEKMMKGARDEASRQGVHPLTQAGIEMVGEGAGSAPYFIPGIGAAHGAATKIAGKLGVNRTAGAAASEAAASMSEMGAQWSMAAGKEAFEMAFQAGIKPWKAVSEIPAAAAIQGLYDAAKADDGHRLQDGLMGAAIGAGAAGLFEGVVGLRQWLKKSHQLSDETAEAIEQTAKGVGNEQQQALSASAITADPTIGNSLEQWLTESVKKAKITATPREAIEVAKGSKISLQMLGADGKEYTVRNLDPANIDKMVERINGHLEKGGEILSVKGDSLAINKLYKQFDNFAAARGEHELPVVIKGGDPQAGPLVKWGPQDAPVSAGSSDVVKPTEAPTAKITTADMDPLSFLEAQPDGWILDKKNGARYASMESAMRANKIKFAAKADFGDGFFFGPQGEKMRLKAGQDHYTVAEGFLKSKGIDVTPDDDAIQQMLDIGFVRTRKDGVEVNGDFINKDQTWMAVAQLFEANPKLDKVYVNAVPGEGAVFGDVAVPRDLLPQFIDNPKKTFMQLKKGIKFELNKDINAKKSVYHATDLEGFRGVLSEGKIKPSFAQAPEPEPGFFTFEKDGTKTFWQKKDAEAAHEYASKENVKIEFTDSNEFNPIEQISGVSVSRTPRIASKGDKAITFVIDPDKAPRMRPFVEEGYGKTIDLLGGGKEMDPLEKAQIYYKFYVDTYGPDSEQAQKALANLKDTAGSNRNPHFEFEDRTFGEAVDLSAVKGVLIDKAALIEQVGEMPLDAALKALTPEERKAYDVGNNTILKLAAERVNADLDNRVAAEINKITAEAKAKGLDVKVFENGKEMHAYRAKMSKYPEGAKWEVGDTENITTPTGNDNFTLKERPLAKTGMTNIEEAYGVDAYGFTQGAGEGNKPTIILNRAQDDIRRTWFHENMHGHMNYLGIDDVSIRSISNPLRESRLHHAFDPEIQKFAGKYFDEEIVTYLTTAVRVNDTDMLEKFVKADESLENVMRLAAGAAEDLKLSAMSAPPSLHRDVFLRKMDAVSKRAGTLEDLARDVSMGGHELHYRNGKYHIMTAEKDLSFSTREEVAKFVEETYTPPQNIPNLIDESYLVKMPRYEIKSLNPEASPLTTDSPVTGPPGGRVQGGVQALSFYFRPFYSWVQTVSDKNNWPELYSIFKGIDEKQAGMDAFVVGQEQKLYSILKDLSPGRRKDLYHYLETPAADKSKVATELHLTAKDIERADKLRKEFYDPLANEFGIDATKYIEDYAPRIRERKEGDPFTLQPTGRLAKEDVDFWAQHLRTGELDPRETDLLRVSHTYLRAGARQKFLGPQLEEAARVVNAKDADGNFVLGTLQPAFKRHLDFITGRPDFSEKVIHGALTSTVNTLNEVIADVNKKLPAALQMSAIEKDASEILGRFALFSYAGTLGARPMTAFRDALQLFMTTYPLLGGKYMSIGLRESFAGIKKGQKSDLYKIAEKYGALMTHSDLRNLYATGSENLAGGTAVKLAEKMLVPMQWANNSNRLVSFAGHAAKALDAIKKHRQDPQTFIRESGLVYADPLQAKAFAEEAMSLSPAMWDDLSYRISKEMTDLSQWNYRRGAHPGIYKYAAGRLLGQYGTWPMNYIEFARRITRSGEISDRVKALSRLAAAHYTILKVGEAYGVDTANWVFTAPMAYAGSPFMTAALKAPLAIGDTQSSRGDEARRELFRAPQLAIPGGLAMGRSWEAFANDDPNMWKIMLGFNPLDGKEEVGLHQLP